MTNSCEEISKTYTWRFAELGVERRRLHEWSAHERVGGHVKSKLFSKTKISFLFDSLSLPGCCDGIPPHHRCVLRWFSPAALPFQCVGFHSGWRWAISGTISAHCLISAPTAVRERRGDHYWYRSGTLPIQCTELPLGPDSSLCPSRRIAFSMRRSPIEAAP